MRGRRKEREGERNVLYRWPIALAHRSSSDHHLILDSFSSITRVSPDPQLFISCGRAELLYFRCTYTYAEGVRPFFSRMSSGVVRGRRGFTLARRDKETRGHTIGSPSSRWIHRVHRGHKLCHSVCPRRHAFSLRSSTVTWLGSADPLEEVTQVRARAACALGGWAFTSRT